MLLDDGSDRYAGEDLKVGVGVCTEGGAACVLKETRTLHNLYFKYLYILFTCVLCSCWVSCLFFYQEKKCKQNLQDIIEMFFYFHGFLFISGFVLFFVPKFYVIIFSQY